MNNLIKIFLLIFLSKTLISQVKDNDVFLLKLENGTTLFNVDFSTISSGFFIRDGHPVKVYRRIEGEEYAAVINYNFDRNDTTFTIYTQKKDTAHVFFSDIRRLNPSNIYQVIKDIDKNILFNNAKLYLDESIIKHKQQQDSIKAALKLKAEEEEKESLEKENKLKKELEDITKSLKSNLSKYPIITYFDFSSSYTSTSVNIQIINNSNKKIKYITFAFKGYNAVDDIIKCPIKKKITLECRGIGPINQHEAASYNFENVWWTELVDRVKIEYVKVEYFDGSIKKIKFYNMQDYDSFMLLSSIY